MTWEWRVFWCVEQSASRPAPGETWVRDTARELRGHDFSVATLNSGERRVDNYLHIGNAAYGLKVRDAQTERQVVELKVCAREEDGLRQWRKAVSVRSGELHPDGVLRRRVLKGAVGRDHPHVVEMFEGQKALMERTTAGREMGTTRALNVRVDKFRAILVQADGVELEVSECIVQHGGWRSVWRSLAIEGRPAAVTAKLQEERFRGLYRREGGPYAHRVVVGGYPDLVARIVEWVTSAWRGEDVSGGRGSSRG